MAEERAFHYVCTHEEARALVDREERFWVSDCGCRVGRGHCERSRTDICLQFRADAAAPEGNRHEITRAQLDSILAEAETHRLVTRPYRDAETRTQTRGICFCCDDCCGYFLDPQELCDKGTMIQATDMESCNDCLACLDLCYFRARTSEDGALRVDADKCYGCGLCVASCPTACIRLVVRGVA